MYIYIYICMYEYTHAYKHVNVVWWAVWVGGATLLHSKSNRMHDKTSLTSTMF